MADELYGANKERVLMKTKEIYNALLDVYHQAEKSGESTITAANHICENVLESRGRRNNFYTRSVKPKWDIRS